jgi:hypothetical protein
MLNQRRAVRLQAALFGAVEYVTNPLWQCGEEIECVALKV